MARPADAKMAPAMVTARHPYLFVNEAVIGPEIIIYWK